MNCITNKRFSSLKMLVFFSTFATLLLSVSKMSAQIGSYSTMPTVEKESYSYGAYGRAVLNMHNPNFTFLPNYPSCCNGFESGSGGGVSIGLLLELELNEKLKFASRVGYSDRSGILTRIENTVVSGNVPGQFEHTIDASIGLAVIQPMIAYNITGRLNLYAGPDIGIMATPISFSQKEEIIAPANGTFTDTGRRRRNEATGDAPSSALQFGVLVGASYDFPMNSKGTLVMSPEIFYHHAFTNLSSEVSWKVNALEFGVAVKYTPLKPIERPMPEIEKPKKPDPPIIVEQEETPLPTLTADLRITGVDSENNEKPALQIKVEEFLSMDLRPILPYVFFDENSSDIPRRYKIKSNQEALAFNLQDLFPANTLDTYYDMLNIIGKRLKEFPAAAIVVTGCNSDEGSEKGNIELSKQRAETVKNYLTSVWSIDKSRIKVAQRNLPDKQSNITDADGIVENRRVEITSNQYEILAPLSLNDTLRTTNPPILKFYPSAASSEASYNWDITVTQQGKLLKSFDGASPTPTSLAWNISDEKLSIPQASAPLAALLRVNSLSGLKAQSKPQYIEVEQVTIRKKRMEQRGDKEIDHYSLILFDFDQSDISGANRKIIDLIKSRIKPNALIAVEGYTDRSGEDKHNLTLSQQRATAAAKALNASQNVAVGKGENSQLFTNDLPEGRFYSRTVMVTVETPTNK